MTSQSLLVIWEWHFRLHPADTGHKFVRAVQNDLEGGARPPVAFATSRTSLGLTSGELDL